jgi:hypothetical protein
MIQPGTSCTSAESYGVKLRLAEIIHPYHRTWRWGSGGWRWEGVEQRLCER